MPAPLHNLEVALFRRLRRNPPKGFVARAVIWLIPLALLLVAASFIHGAFGTFCTALLILLIAVWIAFVLVLLYRWLSRRLLWRVSNRLIVTYLLMGLAPVVLFVTLAAIAAYVFSGQFATYAATSQLSEELDRLSSENRAYVIHIGHTVMMDREREVQLPVPTEVFGGAEGLRNLQMQAWDNGKPLVLRRNSGAKLQDAEASVTPPPSWLTTGFYGVVTDGGRLYLRAYDYHQLGGHTVSLLSSVPLSGPALNHFAHGLGEVTIFPTFNTGAEDNDHHTKANLDAQDTAGDHFQSVSGGMLPPAAFFLDMRVFFTAPLKTIDWQTGKSGIALMNVTSRPTLLYQRLFETSVQSGVIIRDVLITIGILFALLELIAFVMALRLSRTITKSVADLYGATTEIDHGNFGHRIQVTRHDQLAALSTSFNRMSESLERLLEQQREKDRMQSELAIAQEVQYNLFPRSDLNLPALELHGVCKPARTVSGDYYDFLLLGNSELFLAMGDISGKGISAALLMASLHSAVRAYRFAGEELGVAHRATGPDASPFASPGQMLSLLNRHLYRSTQPEKYATLFLAHYSSQTCKLTYSNGGQLPPFVLCNNGSVRRLDCGGSVVGLLDGMEYEQATVTLEPGEILIAYSDGVTEPENDFGEFGEERLLEIVARHRHLSLSVISSHVLQALNAWIGQSEQPDDITLVLARQT